MIRVKERISPGHLYRLAAIISVISLVGAYTAPAPIISYPLAAAGIACLLFLVTAFPLFSGRNLPSPPPRLVTAVTILGIASIPTVQRISSEAISDIFYILAFLTCSFITIRILIDRNSPIKVLLLIMLFSIVLRSTFWFSSLVVGQDSLYHMGIIGWIMETGDFLPDTISYYSNYPAAHHLAAVGAILMGYSNQNPAELKLSTFLTLSIAQTLGILFAYCLTSRLTRDTKIPLLGALVFGIATGPMIMGANPIAQSAATTLVAGVIWTLTIPYDKRVFLICLLLSCVAVVTHNLAPIVIAGSSTLVFLSGRSIQQLLEKNRSNFFPQFPIYGVIISSSVGVAGIYYWIQTEYFRYQVVRVAAIISFSGTGADAITSTNSAEPPQVEVFGYLLPGVLMWAAQLIVLIILVGLGIWIVLDIYFQSQEETADIPDYWVLTAAVLFGLFAIAYAIGGSGPVTRSLPTVTLIITPLVAFGLLRLAESPPLGPILTITMVCAVLAASILMPGLSYQNREAGDFRPTAEVNEVEGINFIHDYVIGKTASDAYISGFDYWNQVARGKNSTERLNPLYTHTDPSSAKDYKSNLHSQKNLFFRERHNEVYGIHPPQYWGKIYHSSSDYESGIYTNNNSNISSK